MLIVKAIRDEDLTVNQWRMVLTDITRRKKYEEELIKAREKAKENENLKSIFLANMSHEIRTPLNGILGFTELLENEPEIPQKKQQKYLKMIRQSGIHMLHIINELIDISKAEAGQVNIHLTKTDINKQLEYLYEFFKPEAESKNISLIYKTALQTKEAIIKTDTEKFYRILANLIKNAIKFTKTGSVEFGYQVAGSFLEFYVKDTGVGIAKTKQKTVFNRYVQTRAKVNKSSTGAGLGLPISKTYVELLGGEIWMESKRGEGSQFYFTIPYHKSTGSEETSLNGNDAKLYNIIKNTTILIVDDDQTSLMYLNEILKNKCHQVLWAKTGEKACELVQQNQKIDLILIDIKLPKIDGLSIIQKIREIKKDMIIIAETAYMNNGIREKALNLGFDDFISKPINRKELFKMINNNLRSNKYSVQ